MKEKIENILNGYYPPGYLRRSNPTIAKQIEKLFLKRENEQQAGVSFEEWWASSGENIKGLPDIKKHPRSRAKMLAIFAYQAALQSKQAPQSVDGAGLLDDGRFVYAYASIEEYMKLGSWTDISEAFRVGWKMARFTRKDLQEIADHQEQSTATSQSEIGGN